MPLVNAGQRVTAALLSSDYAQGDTSASTVTAAVLTGLTKAWPIPAGDAAASAAYRVTAWGFGTWGSTQQTLRFAGRINSSAFGVGGAVGVIAATALAASAAFRWDAELTVICVTPGSSATWWALTRGTVMETANDLNPGTAADNSVPFSVGNNTAYTQDSTVANSLDIGASWGSATGAPTLTCVASTFEKLSG